MPQKLVDKWGTINKQYPYEIIHKKELHDMQMTLQTLHSSYTYLKIPKNYAHMWVEGIYQLPLFFGDQPIYHLWR